MPSTPPGRAHGASDATEPPDLASPLDVVALRSDNIELRHRVELAEREIARLRTEALARRAEVRKLAESFPAAMSRHALVTGMLRDLRHHPDKRGVLIRAVRKLGRGPRKAARLLRERTQ